MTKTINATQQSLRLLVYSLAGISAFFITLRLLMTYVLGSQGMMTAASVLVVSLIWVAQSSQQFRAKGEQEALLMQHRAFAAEVERAWERSHANDLERRKAPHNHHNNHNHNHHTSVPSQATNANAEGSSKKRKKKKRAEEGDEETFIVDDELEAEVVEDLEDFLEHSRLRQTLKKTADELRLSQKRKEDKKAITAPPEVDAKKVPETKVPETKAPIKTQTKKEEQPAKGAGGKGANRKRLGEEKSKNPEPKDQAAHIQRTGTNGTKQHWQDHWYGESSWWPEQDMQDGWGARRGNGKDWWTNAPGRANGVNGRRDGRGGTGRVAPGWK